MALMTLALLGVLDAGYLVWEHYSNIIPPCSVHSAWLVDCGAVLRSEYSVVFGIPLAVLGLTHYLLLALWLASASRYSWFKYLILLESAAGAAFSFYLVYLQLGVIGAICLYCMISAIISLAFFFLAMRAYSDERRRLQIWVGSRIYRFLAKPLFFIFDPELVHTVMTRVGELCWWMPWGLRQRIPVLRQKLMDISFDLPIGLAAGFDYEGRLTRTLAPLGFGFQSIGTITHLPWVGNQKPRLGRLPKSSSLMVNKGFRNPGSKHIAEKLRNRTFDIPVGVSVGDAKGDISEIVAAFKCFEKAQLNHHYYELNISCPNLPLAHALDLEKLLTAVDRLKLSKPVWVKMPINHTDAETLAMLKTIAKHSPQAVIFGNLQKDRRDPSFDGREVVKFSAGNFSGKPTFIRSNQLIKLAYKNFKQRFVIVGVGGVFSAEDAYTKIRLGASLVQLITGMIYQGPMLIADINSGLEKLLARDGYRHISEAVGVDGG